MTLTPAALTLGVATLGNLTHAMSDAEAHAVLVTAWECGVRSFDTAPHYGLGLSERRLGDFLSGMPRGEFRVSTKVGRLLLANPGGETTRDADLFDVPAATRRVWDFTSSGVRASHEQSLERLGLDHVDTLYLHDPEQAPRGTDALTTGLAGLSELRSEGLVDRVGIGSMSLALLDRAAHESSADELMVAGRHTLLDHSATKSVLPACAERGLTVSVASVFNSGLLATPNPSGTFDYVEAPAEAVDRAQRIADICENHGTDLPTAALHYVARHAAVTSVVFGARTPEHVRENVARAATPPPEDLWTELTAEGLIPGSTS